MLGPSSNPPHPARVRRRYHSPKREEAALKTRQKIREAAETLFLRDGYARTSMKTIATHAGVSEKTMYLAYATKATLLRHVIEVAVRGDEATTPLSQRPQWRAVLAGPPEEIFTRFAALNAALMARTAAIIALAESAADTDAELAEHRDRAHEATRDDLRSLARAIKHRGALAPGVSEHDAADVMFALAADESIYLRLTRECGWTETRYADLTARTLSATLGRSSDEAR
jgi:AcrR family transcriptional regulator